MNNLRSNAISFLAGLFAAAKSMGSDSIDFHI